MSERSETSNDTEDLETGAEDMERDEAATGSEGAGVKTAEPDSGAETPGHIDEVAAPSVELDTEEELEELRDRHLRLAAEFDNFRRRTRRELLETVERGRAELAADLLEVLDDLQRVADTPVEGTTTEALHQGVELVSRKLKKSLSDAGMEVVDPVGDRFDPNLHEALFVTETDDPERDETVSQVILVGYRLGERLLRPAQVGVFRFEEETS